MAYQWIKILSAIDEGNKILQACKSTVECAPNIFLQVYASA